MANFVTSMVRFFVRLVVLALGLLLAASLMLLLVAFAIIWGLSALWARTTGRPMTPWVMRVNPSAVWSRASQAASRWQPSAAVKQPKFRSTAGGDLADVTDVHVKEL